MKVWSQTLTVRQEASRVSHHRRPFVWLLFVFAAYAAIAAAGLTLSAQEADGARAKYVFLFIGDGMGLGQRKAAGLYLDATEDGAQLTMSRMPVHGYSDTVPASKRITDSAAGGTALATGVKTMNGMVGMLPDGTVAPTIAEQAKAAGMKVGIISSVGLDHATPACFYAHSRSRGHYYAIGQQLTETEVDYFGGGGFIGNAGSQRKDNPDLIEVAKQKGFTFVDTRDELMALKPGVGKVLAFARPAGGDPSIAYELDRSEEDTSLVDLTRKGIELLDGPQGFFMMVEGGRIDWACHANDAATTVHETIAFDAAVAEGVAFAAKHPGETLIVVTADHATGGLTIGYRGTGYAFRAGALAGQKVSIGVLSGQLGSLRDKKADLSAALPVASEACGFAVPGSDGPGDALSDYEMELLDAAWQASLGGRDVVKKSPAMTLLYGSQDPFALECVRIVAHRAGMEWTTFAHTGEPVPVMAMGVGQESFVGYYQNTDIPKKMRALMGLDVAVPVAGAAQ